MGRFSVKIHESRNEVIIAIADENLIGKTLHDKKRDIDFVVSKEFYGDEFFDLDYAIEKIRNGTNINLIGNEIIEAAIKENLIESGSFIEIDGIKHAQIYKL